MIISVNYSLNFEVISMCYIKEKLHFITLNYTPYQFCTLNYDHFYTLHLDVKFSVNLDGNSKFRVQSVIKSIFRVVKYYLSFIFKVLRRWAIRSFHMVLYFPIQVNKKLNVEMQSVINVIVQGTKCAFKKFRGAKCNQICSLGW